jgi:hypothetical protein
MIIILFIMHVKPGIMEIPPTEENRTESLQDHPLEEGHDYQVIFEFTYELTHNSFSPR